MIIDPSRGFFRPSRRIVTMSFPVPGEKRWRRTVKRRVRPVRRASGFGLTAIGENLWHTLASPLPPDQVQSAEVLAYYRVPESIQMAPTPEANGGGTGLTFSTASTFVGRSEQILITVPTGGARGTAKLNVFVNGVQVMFSVTTSASPIPITGTDISINCPAITYSTSMSWRSSADHFLDKIGAYPSSTSNFFNTTVGATRPYIINPGNLGSACIRFDGSNDLMTCTGPLAALAYGGVDKSFYTGMLIYVNGLPGAGANGTFWAASNLTNVNQPRVEQFLSGTNADWRANRVDDDGTNHVIDSVIPATLGGYLIEYFYDGLHAVNSMNSSDLIGGTNPDTTGLQGPATITPTQISLGCRTSQAGSSGFVRCDVMEKFIMDGRPERTERQRMYLYYNQ